jgi:hypothetical protein
VNVKKRRLRLPQKDADDHERARSASGKVKGLHGRRQLVLRFDLTDAGRCRECGDDGGLELEGVRGGTKLHGALEYIEEEGHIA